MLENWGRLMRALARRSCARVCGAALGAVWAVAAAQSAVPVLTFESGPVRPLALSSDGGQLYAVNTPDARIEVFAVGDRGLTHLYDIPVGL